ncbi:GNAT family N-acetyltransferase [Cohnella endophytica]|uniref:GNAT family N-acetyltransferase n=1 Tax=Cohnella endophytica TaxID=2419778 RepID=A0A494Y7D1_9BACL|nr:GNAT family N-acetyltransferase [Cohnella endophytica]RKP57983.1 GNAT family N-acetyltransferase [Cohnella endophytica]
MLRFVETSINDIELELEIINSNMFFNVISKDKDKLTHEDLLTEITDSIQVGAERYLIKDKDKSVGVIEFLMKNPNDGFPWLGLLIVKKEFQNKGYGSKSLNEFYKIMSERKIKAFRIGVLLENEPAHFFWRKHGFIEVTTTMIDNKEIMIYEKRI